MGNVPPSALRQPPPPGRCLLIDSNKVAAPTTSKGEGDRSRVRIRPFYYRRCKKANPSNSMIESLPDELLIEILVCLSADDIYDNARLVCRRWFHLIHSDAFVSTHLQRASTGLLFKALHDLYNQSSPVLVTATRQGLVEILELSCRVKFPILCSCNGLALCLRKDGSGERIPFIFNPATKFAFNLPRLPVGEENVMYELGIAYAAASMAYKVVGSYVDSERVEQCGILTVGVDDAWRNVAIEGLSPEAKIIIQVYAPLMTGGFLHWVYKTLVVSLNVETEIFTETPTPALMFPPDYQESKHRYCCLSTGECLSLFLSAGDEWSWEVWEMKPETCEWRKVIPKINLEPHKCKIQQFAPQDDDFLEPVGWVRYPELLAFSFNRGRTCIIYNLNTEEFESIELSFPVVVGHRFVGQHRSSLVWS